MIEAKFTQFDNTDQWVSGKADGYLFHAKLFDVGSPFGINNGRVSKLSIAKDGCPMVVNYDRGWDIKPTKEVRPYYRAIMKLLENSPKRFS